MLPAQPNRSLLDGIDVLLALASSEQSVGSRELARRLGLEPTRVNRLLKTLAAIGMATQNADRRYMPGPGMHVLSAMSLFGSGLLRRSVPVLERLDRFGVVVALGVLWRDQVAYLYHKLSGMSTTAALGRAGLFPATRSSIGIVLLAHRSDDEARAAYVGSAELASMPYERFQRRLSQARNSGVAVMENELGLSIAAAIHAPSQPPYAAVAVSGPLTAELVDEAQRAVQEAAIDIARAH